MIKIFLKRYSIILISICVIGTGVALACAGDAGPEYGTSNFTPEVFVDSAYSPFFYSINFYYGIGHDENHDMRFNTSNIAEWSGYFSNKYPSAGFLYLLELSPASSIDSAASWLNGNISVLPDSLKSLNLFSNRNDKKVKAFIHYLSLAKSSEDFAANNRVNSWDYDPKKKKTITIDVTRLNNDLKEGFIAAKDPFLKERYWFQLVRSYFFNGSPEEAISLFDSQEKQFPHNKMYYRTLAYVAGVYYRKKEYGKANYYYSRVYDGCDELKTVAHYSFHPQEEKDWQTTLSLCRNNDEKATLWQMLGVFYSDEKRAIGEIYRLNPKSDKLDLLLSRAVNGAEQRMITGLNNYYAVDRAHDTADNRLIPLITGIADAANTGKPWIWQLSAGYLNMLDGKYANASLYYSRAEKTMPRDLKPQYQLRLLKLLNNVVGAKTIDNRLENEWRPDLEWLWGCSTSTDPQLRCEDAFAWIRKIMALKYKKQNALVKSECFTSTNLFYLDNRNVEEMKTFLNKPGKTSYEDFCARLSANKLTDLNEYQAIRLCFEDRTEEAIARMKEAGGSATTDLPGNPFNGRINDCHDCDHAAPQKIKYSKNALLLKIKEMKDKIAGGQDIYTNSILLGNAYYNLSHYGNARAFYECKILGSGQSDPFIIDSVFRPMLTDMKLATKYYTQALNAAQTGEQKAKCQYMLAKCQRNEWYNHTIYTDQKNQYGSNDTHRPDFIAWDGFKALNQYSNTQYYKDLIKECGYFRTYIKK
jgi:hypothetical protein